jgi:hypothetical protein
VSGSLALIGLLLLGPQQTAPDATRQASGERAAARAVLQDVLSQRAFLHARDDPWTARARRRAGEWLTDLWTRLVGSTLARPSASRAVAWILSSAAVCVLIAWLLRLATRNRRADAFELAAPVRDGRSWRALAQDAAELIRAGEIRDGARLAYRAAIQRLQEEGAFTSDATRTPREYLRLVPETHRNRPALSTLTGAFERIWYGSRTASGDEGRQIVTLLQELECLPREQAN